jgi:hypothetical protein
MCGGGGNAGGKLISTLLLESKLEVEPLENQDRAKEEKLLGSI